MIFRDLADCHYIVGRRVSEDALLCQPSHSFSRDGLDFRRKFCLTWETEVKPLRFLHELSPQRSDFMMRISFLAPFPQDIFSMKHQKRKSLKLRLSLGQMSKLTRFREEGDWSKNPTSFGRFLAFPSHHCHRNR